MQQNCKSVLFRFILSISAVVVVAADTTDTGVGVGLDLNLDLIRNQRSGCTCTCTCNLHLVVLGQKAAEVDSSSRAHKALVEGILHDCEHVHGGDGSDKPCTLTVTVTAETGTGTDASDPKLELPLVSRDPRPNFLRAMSASTRHCPPGNGSTHMFIGLSPGQSTDSMSAAWKAYRKYAMSWAAIASTTGAYFGYIWSTSEIEGLKREPAPFLEQIRPFNVRHFAFVIENGQDSDEPRLECFYSVSLDLGANFHGKSIHVALDPASVDVERSSINSPCPSEYFSLPQGMTWTRAPEDADRLVTYFCGAERKLMAVVAQSLNGTIYEYVAGEGTPPTVTYSGANISEGTWEEALLGEGYTPPTVALLWRQHTLKLYYCDFDQRSVSNNLNWAQAFDMPTWILIAVSCLLVALVSSVSVGHEPEGHRACVRVRLHPTQLLNSLSLVTRGDSDEAVHASFQVAVGLAGFLLMTHYEMFMTGLVVVPPPPLEYNSLRELLENGYKLLLYGPKNDTSASEREYAGDFRRAGFDVEDASSLLRSSIVHEIDIEKWDTEERRRHTAEPIFDNYATAAMKQLQLKLSAAAATRARAPFCHVAREPLREATRLWILFHGHLRGQMLDVATRTQESGLAHFWHSADHQHVEDRIEYKLRRPSQRYDGSGDDDEGPEPVSMDFQVMIIFPVAGVLYIGCVSVLFLEFVLDVLEGIHEFFWLL